MTTSRQQQLGACLVTGGAGFIGCAISGALAERFERVVVLDNLHPQIHKESVRPQALDERCELVVGDVCDPAVLDQLLAKLRPSVVIHLAAETGTGQSLSEASRHAMVNVVGTSQLLDALRRSEHIPAKIILSSSRAVYGEGQWRRADGTVFEPGQRTHAQLAAGQWDFDSATALPFQAGTTPASPTSVYGATKLAQEHVLSAWTKAHDCSVRTLRLQNVYGPGQSLSNPYTGIVSLFVRMAKGAKPIPLYEDGAMTRDFVFIDDVASAILAAIETETGGFVLDVGTGRATTIREVAQIVASRYGAPEPVVTGQFRNGDVRHAACDISRTLATLDWQPQVSLEEGLGRLCEWIDQQPNVQPVV